MMKFDRRRFLKSATGVCIALPALEYFAPSGAFAQAQNADGSGQKAQRILFCYIPNGAYWQPSTPGPALELPPTLASLEAVKDYITIVSGMNLPSAHDNRAGDHARATAAFLTANTPGFPGPMNKRSIDYDLADIIGSGVRYPTLTLGGEGMSGSDNGYAEAYQSNFSWSSPNSPSTKETDPQAIFRRLFGSGGGMAAPQQTATAAATSAPEGHSILDYVLEEANALDSKLGSADKKKLDEYLTSVRDLEKRVFNSGTRADASTGTGQCTQPTQIRQSMGYQERIPLLYEMMYHAFACDLTRVGTFMVANEASPVQYGFAGVPRSHHEVSHDASDGGRQALQGILKWHIQQLAGFLTKLQAANLLDSTLVMMGAGMGDGAAHNHDNLALLVAGRVPGVIAGGRHVAANRLPLSNLLLTLGNALGANWTKFGESTGALPMA